jgi:hypothetical protein
LQKNIITMSREYLMPSSFIFQSCTHGR